VEGEMYDLAEFKMSEMIECGSAIRKFSKGSCSMEEAANRIVRYLYANFTDKQTGKGTLALVRFYKTHPYAGLDDELKEFAHGLMGDIPESPEIKCLTLLATKGDNLLWNSRKNSAGHKAIPLPSPQVVEQIPMIAQLIIQFGLDISSVVHPKPHLILEPWQKSFNVFYVEEAAGSPYVPAQENFVIPFGIHSVIGFGGMLPDGNLFAVIMFSKIHISRDKAELFRTLSLSAKKAVLPFTEGSIFARVRRETGV